MSKRPRRGQLDTKKHPGMDIWKKSTALKSEGGVFWGGASENLAVEVSGRSSARRRWGELGKEGIVGRAIKAGRDWCDVIE